MRWRVVKRVYSDGHMWFYLQKRNWIGIFKDYEPAIGSLSVDRTIWLGFFSLEDAIKECDLRNNIVTTKETIPVYPLKIGAATPEAAPH